MNKKVPIRQWLDQMETASVEIALRNRVGNEVEVYFGEPPNARLVARGPLQLETHPEKPWRVNRFTFAAKEVADMAYTNSFYMPCIYIA